MSTSKKKRVTITEIIDAVYCEQKLVFAKQAGKTTTQQEAEKLKEGVQAHKKFETQGQELKAKQEIDKRQNYGNKGWRHSGSGGRPASACFIATHVYGFNAPETNYLRQWRDDSLMQTRIGRMFVRIYYLLSPKLIPLLRASPKLSNAVKKLLDGIILKLRGGK